MSEFSSNDLLIFAIPAIGVLCGLFSIVCALKDYDWFMNSRRAALFVRLLGRGGARVFYVLLGAAIIAFCAYVTFIDPSMLS
ncbi:MAG: immunity 17 family protein [Synergistaceae bacterium]|nr:immunity 17 family protein [Synergistaceae bacterium]